MRFNGFLRETFQFFLLTRIFCYAIQSFRALIVRFSVEYFEHHSFHESSVHFDRSIELLGLSGHKWCQCKRNHNRNGMLSIWNKPNTECSYLVEETTPNTIPKSHPFETEPPIEMAMATLMCPNSQRKRNKSDTKSKPSKCLAETGYTMRRLLYICGTAVHCSSKY